EVRDREAPVLIIDDEDGGGLATDAGIHFDRLHAPDALQNSRARQRIEERFRGRLIGPRQLVLDAGVSAIHHASPSCAARSSTDVLRRLVAHPRARGIERHARSVSRAPAPTTETAACPC